MNKLFFIGALLSSMMVTAQAPAENSTILYGNFVKDILKGSPYDEWFNEGYTRYKPADATINALGKLSMKDISVEIFLGTWCGDSKREVPRMLKVLDAISFSPAAIKLIGVGGADSLYKQSPQHEEAGKGVFRVPVFIFYRNGKEVNRINEYPSISLEKDMYAILNNEPYLANYRSFKTVNQWLVNGVLTDKNSNSRGLATQLKPFLSGENELNSLGYLLLRQQKKEEALKIFQINASLFPESANVLSSLGEGYHLTGDNVMAARVLEAALELNKDPALVKEILKVLYEVKGVQ